MENSNIYSELRDRIVFMAYEPGLVLKEKALMDEFKVSRTPVREAFIRLEMEGLVRIVPSMGTFVSEISFKKLKEVFEVRSYMIMQAGRLAAMRITEKEIEALWGLIEKMKEDMTIPNLMRMDSQIHDHINRAAKNEVLEKTLSTLRNQTLRIWSFPEDEHNYWGELPEEFEQIAGALTSRDEDESADLLDMHTRRFIDHIKQKLL